jgi:hypothetical protein
MRSQSVDRYAARCADVFVAVRKAVQGAQSAPRNKEDQPSHRPNYPGRARWLVIALAVLFSTTALIADTLVLSNGRRVQGELVGVSGREIQFEERNGSGRRTLRVPREDIDRIEFESNDRFGDRDRDRGFNRDRDDGPFPSQRGLRERQVNVSAREPWTDAGIEVRGGQQISFRADGEVRWGPNRRDGAGGERNSPRNTSRPLADRPAAALIGRVGENGDPFFIGDDQSPLRMRGSGRLYLGINDDFFGDNTGSLRVVVSY